MPLIGLYILKLICKHYNCFITSSKYLFLKTKLSLKIANRKNTGQLNLSGLEEGGTKSLPLGGSLEFSLQWRKIQKAKLVTLPNILWGTF